MKSPTEVGSIYQDQVTDRAGSGKGVEKKLPVARTLVFARRVRPIPRVASIPRRQITWGRTVVGWATVHIRIRGRVVAAVRVVVAASGGRIVIDGSTARRRTVPGTVVVVLATRAPLAVAITVGITPTTWAETTSRWTPSVPVVAWRIGTASARRARTAARVPGDVRLGLHDNEQTEINEWVAKDAYVGHAGDALVLEFATVERLDSLLQVGSRLKLHEADSLVSARVSSGVEEKGPGDAYPSPLALRPVSE